MINDEQDDILLDWHLVRAAARGDDQPTRAASRRHRTPRSIARRRPAVRASAALPIEVAIERASGGVAGDVAGGLELLARSPALWPVERYSVGRGRCER